MSAALPIIVIGAGPAGLAAAEAASASGQPVTLIDENPGAGGQIWRGEAGRWRDARAARLWQLLNARAHVRLLPGTRLLAAAGPHALLLESAGKARELAWERLIICSGARELLLPFPNWTLPGVTGAGAMQALIKGGMPVAGKRVVVAGSGPLLLAVADSVRRHGGTVVAIAEHRSRRELARFGGALALAHPAKLAQALRLLHGLRGVPYLHGAGVLGAIGANRIGSVRLDHRGRELELECDFLACGYGLLPALDIAALLGCATGHGRVLADAAQRTSVDGVWVAGESTGIGGVDKALAEGRLAGLDAIACAPSAAELKARRRAVAFGALLAQTFAPAPAWRSMCKPTTIVCRCEDVKASQLAAYSSWRAAKLQTRIGMGACQGRVCGAACEMLYGWTGGAPSMPLHPVSAASLAVPIANKA